MVIFRTTGTSDQTVASSTPDAIMPDAMTMPGVYARAPAVWIIRVASLSLAQDPPCRPAA